MIKRRSAVKVFLVHFKNSARFSVSVMGRLVITDLFAADAFNKFAGKLVGRMSRNVHLSVSLDEMMTQSPHGFRRITVFAVSAVDAITQIALYLFPFLLYV